MAGIGRHTGSIITVIDPVVLLSGQGYLAGQMISASIAADSTFSCAPDADNGIPAVGVSFPPDATLERQQETRAFGMPYSAVPPYGPF